MSRWRLNLLGDCELVGPSGQPVRLSTRKALAMLAFIALQRGSRGSRQRIASLLWERADAESGRLHLRKALWSIRSECARAEPEHEAPILADGDQVGLTAEVEVDASQFLAAIDANDLKTACSLYLGDFLGDFGVRHAPAFEDWASAQRQELRDRAVEALVQMAEALEVSSAEESLGIAQRLLAIDPLEERAHRVVLRVHQRQGRSAAALSHYRSLADLLQQELDVEPDAATQALQRQIADGRRVPLAPPGSAAIQILEPPKPLIPSRRRTFRLSALGVAVLASAAGAVQWSLTANAPAVKAIFPIVPGVEVVGNPSVSTDGSRLAFTGRSAGGSTDIFVYGLADHRVTRLTASAEDEDNAAWSPDGSAVAFTRTATDGQSRLVVRSLAGGERSLARVSPEIASKIAWAPDGGTILFADGLPAALVRLRLADGRTERLTAPPAESLGDRDPVISADGKTVAFLRGTTSATSALMLVDTDTLQERALSKGNNSLAGIAFAEDGRGLFFSSDRGGDAGLWFVDFKGSEPVRISEGLLRYRGLSGTGSGERLVFEGVRDRSGIFPDAGAKADEGDFRDWSPDVASDDTLLFVSTRSGSQQLWIQAATMQPRPLTSFQKTHIVDPRWSPEAGRIAFVGIREGRADLYVMARTGMPVRLTRDSAEERSPAWSVDGRYLFYISRRGGSPAIWRLAVDNLGDARRVSVPGATSVRVGDDGWIYYVDPQRGGLFRRQLSAAQMPEGPEQRVLPARPLSWDIHRRALTYVERNSRPMLKQLDLTSLKIRSLGDATALNPASAFALRPDGSLLFNRRTVKVELYGLDLG